jgi:hypothetical protein
MGNEVLGRGRSRGWRARYVGLCDHPGSGTLLREPGTPTPRRARTTACLRACRGWGQCRVHSARCGRRWIPHRPVFLLWRSIINSSSTQDFTHHAIRASATATRQPTSPDTILPSYTTYSPKSLMECELRFGTARCAHRTGSKDDADIERQD